MPASTGWPGYDERTPPFGNRPHRRAGGRTGALGAEHAGRTDPTLCRLPLLRPFGRHPLPDSRRRVARLRLGFTAVRDRTAGRVVRVPGNARRNDGPDLRLRSCPPGNGRPHPDGMRAMMAAVGAIAWLLLVAAAAWAHG